MVEGFVFSEIQKVIPLDWTTHYWRAKGGAEVDFVLTHADRRIGIEVKAGAAPRLTRSSRSFIDAYAPEAMLVVSDNPPTPSENTIETTRVRFLTPVDLPSELDAIIQA